MTKPRKQSAGTDWRLLVHDYNGRGQMYGKSHHIASDAEQGRAPVELIGEDARRRADELRAEHSTETVFPGSEFDELVVGRWCHIEQMDHNTWWMNVGGVVLWVKADRRGRPKSVSVHGPGTDAELVPGCEYVLDWRDEDDQPEPPDRPAKPEENAMENDLTNPDQSARGGEGGN